jgi:hypothetical protein
MCEIGEQGDLIRGNEIMSRRMPKDFHSCCQIFNQNDELQSEKVTSFGHDYYSFHGK